MKQHLNNLKEYYQGKKIFLTGHTGFKGAWLLQILKSWGAIVRGYALAPENDLDLFNQIKGGDFCEKSVIADLRDYSLLKQEIDDFQPDFIFHLAAQALVRRSYHNTLDTFSSNVMGTANLLESLKTLEKDCKVIIITTDKVYDNPERGLPFVESDKLGGHDPYSASKAACEIVIDSYRKSFFSSHNQQNAKIDIAVGRAGNVIGGGDFSEDRLIPDIIRSIEKGQKLTLRNPESVRPWQHVLESLSGYLILGSKMWDGNGAYNDAYNFGPEVSDTLTVRELTDLMFQYFPQNKGLEILPQPTMHEANLLILNSEKAFNNLGWQPRWKSKEAIEKTAWWYAQNDHSAIEKCTQQINEYFY